jgi:catechol 2,3-dioxygenase
MTTSTPIVDSSGREPRIGVAPPGYRLPAATRVGAVQLQVSDLERSLAYYQRVLGFHVIGRTEHDAILGAAGAGSALLRLHERPGAAQVPPHGRIGLYHFAILLPERAALGRFVAHLAELGERAGASDHLVSEALYLRDPDGLGIEVYADRPRSDWRADKGELRMSTLPLDLAALIREAGGEPWTGMPAGTTMGHVHLHVGDLDRAAAFYHAALGLDTMVWSYTGALFLAAGGYHHHLGLNTWAGPAAVPAREEEVRLMAWQLVVPEIADLGDVRRSVESAGVAVANSDDGEGWTAADPWGTMLHVVASRRD